MAHHSGPDIRNNLGPDLTTDRLLLRGWRESDLPEFARINADPRVCQYLPAQLDRHQSDALAARLESERAERGWGLWALEVRKSGAFIGYTGLAPVGFRAHFTPAVEVGWRLAPTVWGCGYATEAAHCALMVGFDHVGLPEVVSFTAKPNTRSIAVMRRLGMQTSPSWDFAHPRLAADHPLAQHVLYRITRTEWLANRRSSTCSKAGQG